MRTLRSTEPLAIELAAIIKAGEFDRLRELLASDPARASCVVEDPKGGGRTPLHLFADWPGHNPDAAAIVQTLASAGANLDATGPRRGRGKHRSILQSARDEAM